MPKLKDILAEIAARESLLASGALDEQRRLKITNGLEDIKLGVALRRRLDDIPKPREWERVPPKGGPAAIVFFHVASDNKHPIAELYGMQSREIDYAEVLGKAIDAAKASNPGARVVVLTDLASDIPPLAEIVRIDVAPETMMYSRMRASLAFARTHEGPMVFLDTDVWLTRDVSALLQEGFDIGLTYREDLALSHMPINEGVIFAASGSAAAAFFERCVALYDLLAEMPEVKQRYAFDVRRWRGGQLALAAFVRWDTPPESKTMRNIAGLRCRFLPCADYNYTPEKHDTPASIAGKWAIHFKGNRKGLMKQLSS